MSEIQLRTPILFVDWHQRTIFTEYQRGWIHGRDMDETLPVGRLLTHHIFEYSGNFLAEKLLFNPETDAGWTHERWVHSHFYR